MFVMLTIRADQIDAFVADASVTYLRRLVAHVSEFFPGRCGALGASEVERWVEAGLVRARAHGFESQREQCKYVNLVFSFGVDFDRAPDGGWARDILASGEPAVERMERLYGVALERLEEGVHV